MLADCDFATRVAHDGVLFHGGLDAAGRYLPPRARHRPAAIRAWTEQLVRQGHPTRVIGSEQLDLRVFPNVEQSKLLLRTGARGAMTRILTLIGITEGFGNDGLGATPRPPLEPLFKESLANTCLDHLYKGLMEAHGRDEAGWGNEAGHDAMWYALRDAALDHPEITSDMFENLPIAPPPGYSGPAKPSPEAIGVGQMQLLFPTLDPMFEVLLLVLTQLLVIELVAFGTFSWASDVLSDPQCSAAPEFAPRVVDYIKQDEGIHVAYLQCALSEVRCRTLVGSDGVEIAGQQVIDNICERTLHNNRDGGRRQRLLAYRMKQIRDELEAHPDGARILTDFERLATA